MPEPTLYERLGGVYAISAVVDYFSDQLVQRDTIEKENRFIKSWNAEKAGYRLWLCAVAGGPFQYTGKTLGDAHFDFELTSTEFDAVSGVLADALDHFKLPKGEKEEVLAAFAAFKPAVTAGSILRA